MNGTLVVTCNADVDVLLTPTRWRCSSACCSRDRS